VLGLPCGKDTFVYCFQLFLKYVYMFICGLLPNSMFLYSGVGTAIMLIVRIEFRDGSRQRKTFIFLFILPFHCDLNY